MFGVSANREGKWSTATTGHLTFDMSACPRDHAHLNARTAINRSRRNRRPNPLPPEQRIAVDVETAADMLSISRRHIYELIAAGDLTTAKVGARRLVRIAEIQRYLTEREQEHDDERT